MKKYTVHILILLLIAGIFACGRDPQTENMEDFGDLSLNTATTLQAGKAEEQKEKPVISSEIKVIREGEIEFKSEDMNATQTMIRQTALDLNGYLARENSSHEGNRNWYTAVVRVPAVNFDKLVDRISQGAEYLDKKNIQSQDVSAEFVDLEARVKAKKAVEKRYTELLSEAKGIEEIMQVEGKIAQVREEIEAGEGRMNYLQNRVSLSTLEIRVYEEDAALAGGFGDKVGEALVAGWHGLLALLIGLVYIWPFILLIVAAFWAERVYRKSKNTKLRREIIS